MNNKPIFYDSDVLISFLEIDEQDVLKELFSKIIIPEQVFYELSNSKIYSNLKKNLNLLINENFVEVKQIELNSPESRDFKLIYNGFWSDGKDIGYGEAASMALAVNNDGIVASNNIRDVYDICNRNQIPLITSSIILGFCLKFKLLSRGEINKIWDKMIGEAGRKLPRKTFEEYYEELFKKDCEELLKNYNFTKHYQNSIKKKKAKI